MPTIEITLLGRMEVRVDGAVVPRWSRRHAAAIVKVLALAPARRMHREQLIDLVWPDDTLEDAAPKLHKAAHFARRAIEVPNAVVLRGDAVILCPDADVTVDAITFEEQARDALRTGDRDLVRAALDGYGGELLPDDRYEPWAEDRREQLRLRHLELLRLDGRWAEVIELDPTDEVAHLALMRQHAATGDRHAALRQFERMDRSLRRELGVRPGPEALALHDQLVAEHEVLTDRDRDRHLVGRELELKVAEQSLIDAQAGHPRTVVVRGPGGVGKSALLAAVDARARELGLRVGHGTSAPIEGAWPYAPIVEALADVCRHHPDLLDGLAEPHRREIDSALAGVERRWSGEGSHQRLFVAAAELVRLAAADRGLLLTIDDVHDADDASLRLLHYIARSTREQRVCIVVAHRPQPISLTLAETRQSLLERHGAIDLELGPLDADGIDTLLRQHVAEPSPDLLDAAQALGGGLPFTVRELARQAAVRPGSNSAPAPDLIGAIDPELREVLLRVAVVGTTFDTDELVALSGLDEGTAFDRLDAALDAGVVEPASAGYRFRHPLVREALLDDVPPHRRRAIHRDAARRLVELGASSARIGHHLLEAGATADAVPYLLRAAETEAALGAYRDALGVLDGVLPHASGADRVAARSMRADLLNAIGDPMAVPAYREALVGATPAAGRRLRVRLARCAVMSGDLDTAAAALDGLEPDGGDDDADILLARGKVAYFSFDLDLAQAMSDAAQQLVLAGERNWKVLDLIALQGMLAHHTGTWFDRMRIELQRTRENPEIANAVFDGYLCPAECLLYGQTPYAEVIDVARDLQATARRSGALRAAAFASALIGEAALLSGDLALATVELTEAVDLHHEVGSAAGEAHSLQRLAEVRLAEGDPEEAMRLARLAFPLARGSIIAKHLLQRVFGTMIQAAPDPQEARAIVDRAEAILGWDDACPFCSIMLNIPATTACVQSGDLVHAQRHLDLAVASSALWEDTAWQAGTAEAHAMLAAAEGDPATARAELESARRQFTRSGQPLDAARCERALTLLSS